MGNHSGTNLACAFSEERSLLPCPFAPAFSHSMLLVHVYGGWLACVRGMSTFASMYISPTNDVVPLQDRVQAVCFGPTTDCTSASNKSQNIGPYTDSPCWRFSQVHRLHGIDLSLHIAYLGRYIVMATSLELSHSQQTYTDTHRSKSRRVHGQSLHSLQFGKTV